MSAPKRCIFWRPHWKETFFPAAGGELQDFKGPTSICILSLKWATGSFGSRQAEVRLEKVRFSKEFWRQFDVRESMELWSVSPSPTQRVTLGKSSDLGSSLPARGRSNGQCSQAPSHPSSLGSSLYSWQQWRVIFLKVILGGDLADIQLVVDVCLMQLVSLFLVTFYMSLHRILRCLGWKGHKNQSGCNSFF